MLSRIGVRLSKNAVVCRVRLSSCCGGIRNASTVNLLDTKLVSDSLGNDIPLGDRHWQAYRRQMSDPVKVNELRLLEERWMSDLMMKEDNDAPGGKERKVPPGTKKRDKGRVNEDVTNDSEGEKENDSKPIDLEWRGPAGRGSSSDSTPQPKDGGGPNGDDPLSNKPKNPLSDPPQVYPLMLALPLSSRPLFPGFYKAVTITDERVMKAIREMQSRQQLYIGAFLLKDSEKDTDVIQNMDEIYKVGVFAQITSVYAKRNDVTGKFVMTALLYPHQRIKLEELIPAPETSKDVKNSGDESSLELMKPAVQKIEDAEDGFEDDSSPTEFLKNHAVSLAQVSSLKDKEFDKKSLMINALSNEILMVFKDISSLNSMFKEQIVTFSTAIHTASTNIFEEPAMLADFAAAVSAGNDRELQEILESVDIEQRLEKALIVLKKELYTAELQTKLSKDVDAKIQKRQREYFLMEQLKGIKKELGIDDGREKLISIFKERVEKLTLPETVKRVFDEEINKLATLETSMSEFGVIRNYLDWITSLPWGVTSEEEYSINRARKILDEDHYGLKDVKDRILEFIAVGKLLGKVDGKIVCFVGPPGVGKTSIGKSIARSLNRKFFRFSVGGMADVAEIKGHRRTYIGALPGRIIQALKKCQTQNPLILIDEIDKISHGGMHGDPAAALLELLDPEQNSAFLDNYLDVPIDLSKVLFVCTANTLDTIPRPLLDRMEVIDLTGYVAEEKVKIAENYLAPTAKQAAGLKDTNVEITEDAVTLLMKKYCRESGVRSLKKHIEKIYRKAALDVVKKFSIDDTPSKKSEDNTTSESESTRENKAAASETTTSKNDPDTEEAKSEEEVRESFKVPESFSLRITSENLRDYVGTPIFNSDRIYQTTPPGVVMGLAWTNMGGCSMYVESVLEQPLGPESSPALERTGQLGDVMKESSRLAYSFAKMYISKKFPDNKFFEKASIHLHCPEGATPKDGPSAGVTMASSLLSLALNRSLDPKVAMTGELTLTGKVLRIGGLREKAVAAKRSGASTIIFPKDNLADWEDLPKNVKEGLEPLPADWYDDIFERLFSTVTQEEGNTVWKNQFDEINAKNASKQNK
ncbi:ATP-dependent Lon protease PIM1 Ecym_6190 [Eremothecium cymbalariae DBVPG|uniref:Lon protease homolog, mitochondrial n=1 Tax=Eremothecium cymbalariae (strain CBS 270.75 / DBVPG 7215 / KCTC 17166 / NRRL Y-17582) TaxID=931890 RepID=G8JV94_ERECY|nr:hypothetical protein Ecym_6190 [Eremothecium cymbalariae DBVPG\